MPRTHHQGGSSELRILIVDEHDAYRGACAALLRTEGLEVAAVVPHDDAGGLAEALGPHVVLTRPMFAQRKFSAHTSELPMSPAPRRSLGE